MDSDCHERTCGSKEAERVQQRGISIEFKKVFMYKIPAKLSCTADPGSRKSIDGPMTAELYHP